MPRLIDYTHRKKHVPQLSLSARSGWWVFFVTAFFGRNFFNLSGRACRKEWWVVTLMVLVLSVVVAVIYTFVAMFVFDFSLETADIEELNLFLNGGNLINIIISIPGIAVNFRRFHDLDMSAWWGCLVLPNFILPFIKGKPVDNRFGSNIY